MATFRQTFHSAMATQFVNDVYYGRKSLYYYLGKVDPWAPYTAKEVEQKICELGCEECINLNGSLVGVDVHYSDKTNPYNDPDYAYKNDTDIRNGILYVHKIAPDDISIVIPNHKWISGRLYTQWDNTKDMTKQVNPFYVVNSEYNVYKCLYNNHGSISTHEPRGIGYDVIKTDDKYLWKYMYSIPAVKRTKFVNNQYIPVQRAVDESFYTYGSIEGVIVTNEGSGYSTDPKTVATVEPPKTEQGRQAQISIFVEPKTGSIQQVYIIDRGSGYDDANPPLISIQQRTITGQGKYNGNSEAKLRANILNGELDSVVIEDCGINYLADMETTLSVAGDGEGCEMYPVVIDGKIVDVVIANSGVGYTYATITAQCTRNAANIDKATFKAMLGGSMLTTEQSVVEQTAVPGSIYAIEVVKGGYGYSENTTSVVIDGDGEGCTAHVKTDPAGVITEVIVESYGKDYTYATVRFEDEYHKQKGYPEDGHAAAYVILPPKGGHGYNAVEELYGSIVSIYSNVRDDSLISSLNQDFRQFGIVANLRSIADNTLVKDTQSVIVFDVEAESTTGIDDIGLVLIQDSVVMINNVQYIVISKSGQNFVLQQVSSVYRSVDVGDVIVFTNPTSKMVTRFEITKINKLPHINKHSGDLYYSNNNLPFALQQGRTFGLRTYLKL